MRKLLCFEKTIVEETQALAITDKFPLSLENRERQIFSSLYANM